MNSLRFLQLHYDFKVLQQLTLSCHDAILNWSAHYCGKQNKYFVFINADVLSMQEHRRPLETKMFQDAFVVNQLLGHESSSSEHGQTTVIQLLRRNFLQFSGIRWLQIEWIKANIARGVLVTQFTWPIKTLLGWNPTIPGTVELGVANSKHEKGPEWGWDLGKVIYSGSLNGSIKEKRRSLNLFANEESNSGKHSNTAVGHLGLTVTLKDDLISVRSEAKGIEKSKRCTSPRDAVHSEGLGSSR
jgi:hypothetical protein